MQALQAALPGYDVVCLGETFLRTDASVSFPGFELLRRDRGSHGGGVAMLVRAEISSVPLVVQEAGHLESVWLRVNWRACGRCCVIGTVYRPPNSSAAAFFQDLEAAVVAIRAAHPSADIVICGDTNCHLQEWGDTSTDTAGLAALAFSANTGLIQTVREATLITKSGRRSVIDHCFTDLPANFVTFLRRRSDPTRILRDSESLIRQRMISTATSATNSVEIMGFATASGNYSSDFRFWPKGR
jgi:hypothetical protein